MSCISEQLDEIQERIRRAAIAAGRHPDSVKLIAVSKTFPADAVLQAFKAGQKCFGESRLQEAAPKIGLLPEGLDWHFIGRVQSNKVRKILPLFGSIHAVDSLKLAKYTDGVAGDLGVAPKAFLQVNIAGEVTKGGFAPEDLDRSIEELRFLKHLKIVGLMTIPPAVEEAGQSRVWFRKLRELRDEIVAKHSIGLPDLSMGMSGDFEIAIEEGATHVRVGSAIFGMRDYKISGELG
ncbi:YggS family pyridoxal phosphate-dependent enzyme [Luteolibacter algae]|uniref:Pyridoxal phosphate homeostasis protein n=1 Tax=Luteolibacter algae TaxID=454151 RepID=A0ABW5DB25_9BACT